MKQGLHSTSHGTQRWYKDDLLHREDGPAATYLSGTQEWYQNGVLHREDGPAVIYPLSNDLWYINGVFIADTERGFENYIIHRNINLIL